MTTISSMFTFGGRVTANSDALGHVLGRQRLDVRVDGARLLLVAAEAHAREFDLDEARGDRGDADRAAEQVLAQREENPRTAALEASRRRPFS